MKTKVWSKLSFFSLIIVLTCVVSGCGASSSPEKLEKKLIGKEFWSIPELSGDDEYGYHASCISILFLDEETAIVYDFDTATPYKLKEGDLPGRGSNFKSYDEFQKSVKPTWFEIDDDDLREWDILEDTTFSIEGNLYFAGYHTWSQDEVNEDTWFFKDGNLRIGNYEFTSECPINFKDNDHKYDVEKLLKEYKD